VWWLYIHSVCRCCHLAGPVCDNLPINCAFVGHCTKEKKISLLVCGACLRYVITFLCYFLHCQLTYTNSVSGGSVCPSGGRYSIRIEFSCSKVVGVPLFVEETADCVHHFSWVTPVSCPSLVIEEWTDFIEFKLVCVCVDWSAWKVMYVTLMAFNHCKTEFNLKCI